MEFIEVSVDGTFSILYSWPRALTPSTFGSDYGAALDLLAGGPINSWTAALLPTLKPSIRYCNTFGWYYRYLQIVKVPCPPNILASVKQSTLYLYVALLVMNWIDSICAVFPVPACIYPAGCARFKVPTPRLHVRVTRDRSQDYRLYRLFPTV